MSTAIWIDDSNCEIRDDGEVGFLVETYRPGKGYSYSLRRRPLNDARGNPTLDGSAQPWNDVFRTAYGLATVARRARTTGRLCLRRLDATPELLEQLGYPELNA